MTERRIDADLFPGTRGSYSTPLPLSISGAVPYLRLLSGGKLYVGDDRDLSRVIDLSKLHHRRINAQIGVDASARPTRVPQSIGDWLSEWEIVQRQASTGHGVVSASTTPCRAETPEAVEFVVLGLTAPALP